MFVDTDSDIRLVRRLQRDIMERGRDVAGVIKQYNKFVKPAFEQYIEPTVQVADIVVPRGEARADPGIGSGRVGQGWVSVRPTRLLCSALRWGELRGAGPHRAARAQPAGEGEPGVRRGRVLHAEGRAWLHTDLCSWSTWRRVLTSPLPSQKAPAWCLGEQICEVGTGEEGGEAPGLLWWLCWAVSD